MTRIDLPTLISLVASAHERHVLAVIAEAGYRGVRASHGYVFQRLLVERPTIAELASSLAITPQGASKVVGELDALGYVTRSTGTDARERRVELTESGRSVIELSRKTRLELDESIKSEVGDAGYDIALRALRAAADHLGIAEVIAARSVPMPPEGAADAPAFRGP